MIAAGLLVPLAIRVALRTDFVDRPGGYKGHERVTPYLGGSAVALAIAIAVVATGAWDSRYAALLIWGIVMYVVGTVDDRFNLNPHARLAVEGLAGAALWHYGLGWAVFDSDALNLALTVLWVVGLVNAFNLMDNMDGAASTVAGISAAGTAIVSILGGDTALAVIALAVAGGCCGFLPFNLAKPSRIFLGDGGSMPLGFLIAGAVMTTPMVGELGWSAILAALPIVGLPILDTTLVVISRRRGGRPVLSGGRDHLTHRLRTMLGGSSRRVALCLAAVQGSLCLLAVGLSHIGPLPVTLAAAGYLFGCAATIWALETKQLPVITWTTRTLPADSVTPEKSPA